MVRPFTKYRCTSGYRKMIGPVTTQVMAMRILVVGREMFCAASR